MTETDEKQKEMSKTPTLYFVVPCYNEEAAVKVFSGALISKTKALTGSGIISPDSRILFVDDGSRDGTWRIIRELAKAGPFVKGISLGGNRGQQIALYAGLMEAKDCCDIAVSLDADGQDDISKVDDLIAKYMDGADVVCAARSSRDTDSAFKRITAGMYYRTLDILGIKNVRDHGDYRLATSRAIGMLEESHGGELFLRTDFLKLPLRIEVVEYRCMKRIAGRTKYSPGKMLRLALAGIISNKTDHGAGRGGVLYEIAARC